jgi:multicomponent Na+:H+ antiporter subunit B
MGGMSQIVKDAARLLAGPMLVFGAYLVCYGHLVPGGGLAGGLVIASCFVLLILALGRREGACGLEDATHLFHPLGLVLFLMVGCLGLGATLFFKNYGFPAAEAGEGGLLSGGTALLSNLALGLNLWMGFLVAFLALAGFRRSGDGGGER